MGNVPYPLTAGDLDELKGQIYNLLRVVYEDKIGGADLGDTFSIVGDVLTLVLGETPGLEKTGNRLSAKVASDGGVKITSDGLEVRLDGDSLSVGASGLKVGQSTNIADPAGGAVVDTEARAAIVAILDLLIERGLMAA